MLHHDPSPSEIAADNDAADDEAMAEYQAKGGISHEAIMAWVGSWGTVDELPPPNVGD
jgi:predicted transcriptional regulator